MNQIKTAIWLATQAALASCAAQVDTIARCQERTTPYE